ncbi:MAG: helix-turn-helix transcriptional regulator [Ruminococcaceae bacterium]|nr:helix-turn-helix transcriptional regulator [Oscillospiraceae bacterium]
MDMKKIGSFLKALRKEKGITQEQLAEKLGVAGRTVSRWETASNMPDLSILIQLADFYDIEVGEILDGERKDKAMDKEVKEALTKIADYSNDEKQKAVNVYKFSLGAMFFIGYLIVMTEFALLVDFKYIVAESLPLLIGGCTCIILTIKNGLWDTFSKKKITPARDAVTSFIITFIASIFCYIMLLNRTEDLKRSITVSLCLFVATFLVGFVVLRFLAILSKNKGRKNKR